MYKKGPYCLGKFLTIVMLVSSNSYSYPLASLASFMTTMYVLVRFCIWVLGSYKLKVLGELMGFLEFFSLVVANLLCSHLCLFDTIMSYMLWMKNVQ